jgi:ribosomal protein S18 acetylase RimI-like enzyme
MELRRAVAGDELGIATVHVRTWQAAYKGQLPDALLAGLSVERRAEWWRTTLARAAGAAAEGVYVAVDGGQIVGFVHWCPSRDEDAEPGAGEITSIYLLPDCWDRGAGRRLLTAALDALREAGSTVATLWVLGTNERARRFYEAAGMTPDGATKDDARPSVVLHEVRYAIRLASGAATPAE